MRKALGRCKSSHRQRRGVVEAKASFMADGSLFSRALLSEVRLQRTSYCCFDRYSSFASIRPTVNSSSDPTVRASLTADGLVIEIDTVRKRVETGANPRTPEDVDLLNSQMEKLAEALPPLITLAYTSPKTPLGQSPWPSMN